MIKPSLLVLAAGMGSRYGSLKQMDGVGPNREAIIDYSIYDAIRAGFGKVVFVIRKSFAEDFCSIFNSERFGNQIEVAYVYQELDSLPEGFTMPEGREKPWGTHHAVMMAKDDIDTPFAVINADDFYGADAFRVIAEYLNTLIESKNRYCMVAYELGKTLSENGTVSRGVCTVSEDGLLKGMVERTKIERMADGRVVFHDNGEDEPLEENTPVSMNLFGFTPDYFTHSVEFFKDFLTARGSELKSECYMPSMVNKLISDGVATMHVLRSSAQWYGVTYKNDREPLVQRIAEMIKSGDYPENLWK